MDDKWVKEERKGNKRTFLEKKLKHNTGTDITKRKTIGQYP